MEKSVTRWSFALIAILLLVNFLFFEWVQAGLKVTPKVILERITKEDRSFSYTLTHIAGASDEPLEIEVIPAGLAVGPLGQPKARDTEEELASASKIFEIKPDKFSLPPGESQKINVQVTLPEDAQGGIYKMFIFQIKKLGIEIKGMKPQIVRITSPVMLIIRGPAKRSGEITAVNIHQKEPEGVIIADINFKNTGNIHFSPGGVAIIRDEKGKEVTRASIKPHTAFPGYIRLLRASWEPEGLTPGQYELEVKLKVGQDKTIREKKLFTAISKNVLGQPEMEIPDFSVSNTKVGKPISFQYSLGNFGNVPIFPQGLIQIKDIKDEVVAEISTKKGKLQPGERKELQARIKEELIPGIYTAILEVTYGSVEYGGAKTAIAKKDFLIWRPEAELAGKIKEFSLTSSQPLSFKLIFKNISESPLVVEGMIDLKTEGGKTVDQLALDPTPVSKGETKNLGKPWPTDLSAGSYTAEITLIYGGKTISKRTQFQIAPQGKVKQKIEIVNFSAQAEASHEPIKFEYSLSNEGDVRLTPKAVIKILDKKDQVIKKLISKSKEIAPQMGEEFEVKLKPGLPAGRWKALLEIKYGKEEYGERKIAKSLKEFTVAKKIGKITVFSIEESNPGGPLMPRLELKNRSDSLIAVEGLINITDDQAMMKAQVIVDRTEIPPGETKKLTKLKILKLTGSDSVKSVKLLPGSFKAKLTLVYTAMDDTKKTETVTAHRDFTIQKSVKLSVPGSNFFLWIIILVAVSLLLVTAVVSFFVMRKKQVENSG